MSPTPRNLRFIGDRVPFIKVSELEEAADNLLIQRLGRDAAAHLRDRFSVNNILERYVLGPPNVAASLLEAAAEYLDRSDPLRVQISGSTVDRGIEILESPKSRSERESFDGSKSPLRTGWDPKEGFSHVELLESLKSNRRVACPMRWTLCFADQDLEQRFQLWVLFIWQSKMRYREYILGIVAVALLLSSWPSGPHTRLALLSAVLLTLPQRLTMSVNICNYIQLLLTFARTLTAVLASLYQPLDMRETRLGLGLLSLQAGMVHLLAVSIARKACFAQDLIVVLSTLGFSVVLLPVICSGVQASSELSCAPLQGWPQALLVQVVCLMVVPMAWQYHQELAARKVYLMERSSK